MTLRELRELTKNLPEESKIYYHAWDEGCCLGSYKLSEVWIFKGNAVVMNPGEDYDPRKPTKKEG